MRYYCYAHIAEVESYSERLSDLLVQGLMVNIEWGLKPDLL